MPDPTLSAALKEAYAVAPTADVIYHTLELWHPAFSLPIRVVRDYANIDARIEATAARDAGLIVAFTAYAFNVIPPDQSATALPQCTIEIDNVSREIMTQIDLAIMQVDPITVIYRCYLSNSLSVGSENNPPLEMELITVGANPLRLSATAGFKNLLDKRFPALDYDMETFPGLLP